LNPCEYTNTQIMNMQPQKGAPIVVFIALVTVSPWHVRMTLSVYFPANHNSKYQVIGTSHVERLLPINFGTWSYVWLAGKLYTWT